MGVIVSQQGGLPFPAPDVSRFGPCWSCSMLLLHRNDIPLLCTRPGRPGSKDLDYVIRIQAEARLEWEAVDLYHRIGVLAFVILYESSSCSHLKRYGRDFDQLVPAISQRVGGRHFRMSRRLRYKGPRDEALFLHSSLLVQARYMLALYASLKPFSSLEEPKCEPFQVFITASHHGDIPCYISLQLDMLSLPSVTEGIQCTIGFLDPVFGLRPLHRTVQSSLSGLNSNT